ncbi:hypothetical protein MG293_014919 [Ovis ammon polii]|uniref:Uncharacterized protein n=1 Tax=Ovis ammon polii TaxID=230172 RepID=A0AAD4TX77_OVIAM|nr:hypothetical protein MG293_014919 [Ovis ammon polii]
MRASCPDSVPNHGTDLTSSSVKCQLLTCPLLATLFRCAAASSLGGRLSLFAQCPEPQRNLASGCGDLKGGFPSSCYEDSTAEERVKAVLPERPVALASVKPGKRSGCVRHLDRMPIPEGLPQPLCPLRIGSSKHRAWRRVGALEVGVN